MLVGAMDAIEYLTKPATSSDFMLSYIENGLPRQRRKRILSI